MAIDQREALIAAVRAQVEKEKAAKAAKLKKEQEAMQLSGAADAGETAADHNTKLCQQKNLRKSKRKNVVRKLQNLVLNWRTRNQKRHLQRQQNLRRKSQRRQVMKDLA